MIHFDLLCRHYTENIEHLKAIQDSHIYPDIVSSTKIQLYSSPHEESSHQLKLPIFQEGLLSLLLPSFLDSLAS